MWSYFRCDKLSFANYGRLLAIIFFSSSSNLIAQKELSEAAPKNFLVGKLRVQFAPIEERPTIDPVALLNAAGVQTQVLEDYTEQKNIDGLIDRPVLLARSAPQLPGRWCDIAVPFSTEQFWIQILSRSDGVLKVTRDQIRSTRGSDSQTPTLSISQNEIDSLESPVLEYILASGDSTKVVEAFFTFSRGYYGAGTELGPLGSANSGRPRTFVFDLKKKPLKDPPWQRLDVTAAVAEDNDSAPSQQDGTVNKPKKERLKLIFVGRGAEGWGNERPPLGKFKLFLLDDNLAAEFRDQVKRFGAELKNSLIQEGYAVE